MNIPTREAESIANRPNYAEDRLTTLFTGTKQPSVRDAAITYFYEGLSVIPLTGKKADRWERYQHERALPEIIYYWARAGKLNNVGIICGEVSGNLVVMDLDGEAAVEAYEATFPHLLKTFTVHTGSGKGKHLYYRVTDLPQTIRLLYPNHNAIELRANGLYVVGAPSIHPDTHKPYIVPSPCPIMQLSDMSEVRRWLYQQWLHKQKESKQKPVEQPAKTAHKTIQRTRGDGHSPRWAEAALEYECRDVRKAAEGTRNEQLNRAAYNLGQIVGDGHLTPGRVQNALFASALSAGLSEREARDTIRSGLTAGQSSPRSEQWQNAKR